MLGMTLAWGMALCALNATQHQAQPSVPAIPAILAIPTPAPAISHDFARMFDLARRVLVRPHARAFLSDVFKDELALTPEQQQEYGLPERIKEISESQFMLLLQHNPQAWHVLEDYLNEAEAHDLTGLPDEERRRRWQERFRAMLQDPRLSEVFRKLNDSMTPMRLDTPDGSAGYSNAAVFANHATLRDGKELPPANLKQILLDFINGAEHELMFNVFDFDLTEVADALIAKAAAGVKIAGGIDLKTIKRRPEAQAVFDKLNATPGITMKAVDSVGLNHQKLVVRDFNDPKKAKALFSSGNFTQSCIGPEGDLKDIPESQRPKDSIPNANHMLVVDSYLLAQVAANSMFKTLVFGLRGDEYPLGGAYRVSGKKVDDLPEAPSIIAAFSPKGGLGDINRDMTRRLVLSTRGPLRLLQFALSSKAVKQAVIDRAKIEMAAAGHFDLKAVGETSFAVRPWSVLLQLVGYTISERTKRYVKIGSNILAKLMGKPAYAAMLANIRIAPPSYRNHENYNAKMHHKMLVSGIWAILGTSFNFSEAANSNQEQFLATNDPLLVTAANAIFDGLFAMTATTLVDEVLRRNGASRKGIGDSEPATNLDEQYRHIDAEAMIGSGITRK